MLTVTTTTAHSGSSPNTLHSLVICVYLALVKGVLQYGRCLGEGHGPPWVNGEDWTAVWRVLGALLGPMVRIGNPQLPPSTDKGGK